MYVNDRYLLTSISPPFLQHLDGTVSSYNCSTLWGIGDAVLFYQNGLDPSKEHQVSLVNTGSQSYYKLSLNSFTVYALNGSENAGSSTTRYGYRMIQNQSILTLAISVAAPRHQHLSGSPLQPQPPARRRPTSALSWDRSSLRWSS